MGGEIRRSQLIAPFGPGSIYIDKYAVPTVICGLDYWFTSFSDEGPVENIELKKSCSINEPRLQELLKINDLRQPPEYTQNSHVTELLLRRIPGHRFPRWYFNSENGRLARFNLETVRITTEGKWKPVRFMAVCQNGHMSDFPWKEWIGCECTSNSELSLNDSGGGDLSSIKVSCSSCKKSRNLLGALRAKSEESSSGLGSRGISCCGERPWLGEESKSRTCTEDLTGVLVNQSNVYFSKTVSSIYLPPIEADIDVSEVVEALVNSSGELAAAKMNLEMGFKDQFYRILGDYLTKLDFEDCSNEMIDTAYAALNSTKLGAKEVPVCTSDSELLAFRRSEYNTLRNEVPDNLSSELRVSQTELEPELNAFIDKVNLVERLRETRAFCGFDRLVRQPVDLEAMPNVALEQLFKKPPYEKHLQWLPAVKNYGEGLFIELNEQAIQSWIGRNEQSLRNRFDDSFVLRMIDEELVLPPRAGADWRWAVKYLLVHTLSHILIKQLVFDCGYSSAALKERIFVSNDENQPMSACLIYTASGDSEGSLGGLVSLGRKELFRDVLVKALHRSLWCSADPICAENITSRGSRLINKAACHSCVLLPETACETINNALDRSVVIGKPSDYSLGFFSSLISRV